MLNYRPQLDSLRALAVLAVLLGHFGYLPVSIEGVELFFVLSGFLITRILIDGKSRCERFPKLPKSYLLRHFYVRRFLRIFPPYYALLIILSLASFFNFRDRFWEGNVFWKSMFFHASYTSNFWFAITKKWEPWITSHFWSLSVEEQFYLFWPWIIISVPRKRLWIAAVSLCASAFVFRTAMRVYNVNYITFGTLSPTYFDFLGLGGLLAVVWEKPRAQFILRVAGSFATVLLLLGLAVGFAIQDAMILWAFAFTGLVSKAAEGFTGPVGSFLSWSVLRYIGHISYGIYLYHLPALLFVVRVYKKLGVRFPDVGLGRFVVAGVVTVSIASLSWHLLEGPINRLKRFFPYRARERHGERVLSTNSVRT